MEADELTEAPVDHDAEGDIEADPLAVMESDTPFV